MAEWKVDRMTDLEWCRPISAREEKERIAAQLAERLRSGDVVGVGSGSTSFLTLLALARRAEREALDFAAIVSSQEMHRACAALHVKELSLNAARPDWNFDGADEVSPTGRLLKGRGGALFREKLVMAASLERYIVADQSKRVERLGTRFPVPCEVVPDAVELVMERLRSLGADKLHLRTATAKDGPVITEWGGMIIDASFASDVPPENVLEAIPGMLAVGVFDGWDYKIVSSDPL
jgi:ribose 5-phosphate isomerase A